MPTDMQVNIYIDELTNDKYIFDGTRLIKIESGNKQSAPQIGDRPDLSAEDAAREKQVAQERDLSIPDTDGSQMSDEERERIDRITAILNDPSILDTLEYENQRKIDQERQIKRGIAKKELEKNLSGAERNLSVIKNLIKDIQRFLALQISEQPIRIQSWRKYNANYGNLGLLRPGISRQSPEGKIPLIQIYIDQSGSWSENEVKIAQDIVRSINDLEKKKLIKIQVFYFADHIHNDPATARKEGGTGAGTELMEQLNEQKPDNVIVITDGDFDRFGLEGTYVAPGGVWLVFREVESRKLKAQLKGKLLTKWYMIDKI